jgi:uncharacterized protein
MLIEGVFPVAAPPEALLRHLFDARLMAECVPGCETLEPVADDRYRTVVVVAMAGIKARFDLQVEITRRDDQNVWATTRGEEGGNASTLQADSRVTLQPSAEGTLVSYRSEVSVNGRLGRFALGMMKKKAQSLGDEFAVNLRTKLEQLGAEATAEGLAPLACAVPVAARQRAPEVEPEPSGQAPAARPPMPWWQALLNWLRGHRATAPGGTKG